MNALYGYKSSLIPICRRKDRIDTNLSEWWSSFNKVHSLIYLVHDLAQNSILPVYNESNCHSTLGDPSSIDIRNVSDRRNNLHLSQRFGKSILNWHFQCAFKFRTIENGIGDYCFICIHTELLRNAFFVIEFISIPLLLSAAQLV